MNQYGARSWIGICLLIAALLTPMASMALDDGAYRSAVEADWVRQEQRLGRSPDEFAAIRQALQRSERLLEDLSSMTNPPEIASEQAALAPLREQTAKADDLSPADRLTLYFQIRWLARGAALKNPLIAGDSLVFLKRRRFICQMLHEYLGYFYDYENIAGGGAYVLEQPGRSFAIRDLIAERLPKGNYTTLTLSYDAQTIYFAFAERAAQKPDFYSPDRRSFHIYAMNADGSQLRPLTNGIEDDFDPCPLPDGGIAFMSTRRGGFGRCHNPWEPLPAYTLHRMNADGSGIRTLSYHETNEWHPSVLNDGRIVYTRWDYVDRSAANYHGLWASNPDGSAPMSLFGNYTQRINACYQPRAIPGSNRIIFVAGAHHADIGGSLVILDPSRAALDAQTGEDDFRSLEFLTPEVCFPEGEGWPKSYFHSPWPLSENYFFVSFSFDSLPGMGSKVKDDTETGLYLMDRFGGLELLYREHGISCMYPIPLRKRPTPPMIPSMLDEELGEEGEFILTDVSRSHFPLPADRPIRALRVFQVLPKSKTHVANKPRLGYANAESARMLLGTVPVEADGSAYFRAPARKPLLFQAVDAEGRAVQSMRSIAYLQPGERRGCIGCHEPVGSAAVVKKPLAMRREPSRIEPGPDGSHPWSFPRLVQPILDAHCVSCHDGAKEKPASLIGAASGEFSASYESLRPYVRWFEWGDKTIDEIATYPGRTPSIVSPLIGILEDENHAGKIHLEDSERRRLYLWLDGNAAFFGSYSHPEQIAQRRGEAIPPPSLQ
ncbi:MAG: hypothetical protein AB1656_11630 [Candidatus Omnitrophota bacterium]